MSIGERIKSIRNMRGMTQKYLGMAVGFDRKTADVRIAQYESGTRTPKDKMIKTIASVLGVIPEALTVPNIDSQIGTMHTFFAIEDLYGIEVGELDGEVCIRFDKRSSDIFERFVKWQKEFEKLQNGEITKEEYDHWRYSYPEVEAERTKAALDRTRIKMKEDNGN